MPPLSPVGDPSERAGAGPAEPSRTPQRPAFSGGDAQTAPDRLVRVVHKPVEKALVH